MFIIVGLGNPGDEYTKTRHNAGFLVLDHLFGESDWNKSKSAKVLFKKETISGSEVELLKPQSYMNDSGPAIQPVIIKHSIKPEEIIVVHDEIDLPLGTIRMSFDRGDGGHNGIKSIVSVLGSKAFVRVRVGISIIDENGVLRKPDVLGPFNKADLAKFTDISARVKKSIEILLTEGREKAMTFANSN